MAFPPLVEPLAELTDSERTRTARHRVLAGFGDVAQRRLAAAHVAVVGAGGLGSPAVLALAAAGVGTLTVIDDDLVEASNLQRQVMHRVADVGAAKVESAVRIAADLSPTTVVRPVQAVLTSANARELLAGAHVVVDGTDTFETREAVAAACEDLRVPLVWGVVQEFHAQATVFWSAPPAGAEPVHLADLYPPDAGREAPTCAQVGVLGALCLQVGALLATETIKLITGVGDPLLGRVLVIDALRARADEVPLRPAEVRSVSSAAPAAGESAAPQDVAAGSSDATAGSQSVPEPARPAPIPQLTPAEALAAQRAGAVLLDVREPFETARGVIPGSTLLPLGDVLAEPRRVEASRVVVVCQVGMRAQRAAAALRAAGIEASVLAGGMDAWSRDAAGATVRA
ncbi:ThiF family adenylyltransferase [Microbacterium sp. QXD-8]|uniref:ThiF family adenylyltransferase n=1 Tax=Microbacterium psychrotolerans TaxID=3068321 RepID=A0ABU0Z512_9MICO|nr:ThiF family adenylyltransferase [Microbacterium sp. QXD-8]MDQ7879673.1 ThiF family adenylyltransferase [Microbacterium sp. QXD-8]